ncbi:glycoside hydrolase family 25 protein [Pelagibacterium halotolerans]
MLPVLALGLLLSACARYYSGDNDPHPGVARAHSMPVQGIDVSRHQGVIDWPAVARGGIRFAYIKATDGGDHLDPMFRTNWERSRAAGIPRGAYHFIYWCRPASEQVAWFAQNVPADPDALPPVLDLEWNHQSSCKPDLTRDEALAMIREILAGMERHTGKVPVIYTDITFHRDILAGEPFDNPMWLRSVAAEPHERYENRAYAFWQFTQTGVVSGIKGEVDRNVFYGSPEEWAQFFLTGCDPRTFYALAAQGRCRAIK